MSGLSRWVALALADHRALAVSRRGSPMRELRGRALDLALQRRRDWTVRPAGERAAMRLGALLWPLVSLGRAWAVTRRVQRGRGAALLAGRSTASLVLDCWRQGLRNNVAASAYYRFRLFEPANAARAGEYLQDHEGCMLTRQAWLAADPALAARINDKLEFHRLYRTLGLATVPVLAAAVDGGDVQWLDDDGAPGTLPHADLVMKTTSEASGDGVEVYVRDEASRRYVLGDERLDEAAVIARLRERSRGTSTVLQRRIRNDDRLLPIAGHALSTLRVLTADTGDGRPQVAAAGLRMGRGGTMVDNLNAGGIAAPMDLRTGRLGPAASKSLSDGWYDRHPDSGHPIDGFDVPCWREALELCRRAHAAVPGLATIGWDVPITDAGPMLLEGNLGWDTDLVQQSGRTALGQTPVATALHRVIFAR